ncbi:hypothetical protein K1719_015559 [Acacia pycnantha]|nr:hypothetical protein K1719_015559 [Acacia pycnantha]
MGEAILKYLALTLIILVACHEVDMAQGRQIKALNQQHFWVNKGTIIDSNVPTSSAEMAVTVNEISNKDTNGDVTAYRPTNPGNSPGVGHRKSGVENEGVKEKVVLVQSPPDVVEYSLDEESKNDFRPSDPGHSPGAGRADHQNKNNGEVGRVQNQLAPGLYPGAVGPNALTFSSRLLIGRKAIMVFGVSFAEMGKWPLICLKFLPSTKSSSWNKTNNIKKKLVRVEYAMAKDQKRTWNLEQNKKNLKSQGDQNLANHDQKNVYGGLETPNAIQSPPMPPSEATPSHNIDDFRPTAPGHSPGVGHSVHN